MLLSVRAAATALGVTADTVRAYIREGAMEAVRLPGGSFRIPEEQVAALTRRPAVVDDDHDGQQGEVEN